MSLTINHPEVNRLAQELVDYTGETLSQAVLIALRERLEREKEKLRQALLKEELLEIGQQCASLPILDQRSPEAILGYNQDGVPA